MRCNSSAVRISPARRSARSRASRFSRSIPSPRHCVLWPTMAAACPVLWVMEPLICPGQIGARSSPIAGMQLRLSSRCSASRAHRRPARNSACRLATERWMLAGGGTALRWKSKGFNKAGSNRVLKNTVPGKGTGSGQRASSGVQQAGRGVMRSILPSWRASG